MKCHTGILIHIFVLLTSFSFVAKTEFFTSISEMETLLHTERELAKTLDKYVEAEEKRLEQIRRLGKGYEKMYKSAMGNAEEFLSNPVNAYLLVKHLTADWRAAGQLIDETSRGKAVIQNITQQDLKFPGDEDLSGAATALIRLQETYLLNTTKLASGEIEGAANSLQFSAGDCAELAFQAFMEEDFEYCVVWMQEALKRLEDEEIPTTPKLSVLEYLAYANYQLGKPDEAIAYTEEIIDLDPSYEPAYSNLKFYEDYKNDLAAGRKGDIGAEWQEQNLRNMKKKLVGGYGDYEKLCRGERVQSHKQQSKLHCRYTSRNSSYLILQPIKEEDLSLDPSIVMFHDVISDKDAETLKKLSIPKLERATVSNAETGDLETASYRVSKSSWLTDDEHPLVARIARYIQEVTGMVTNTAEELHVINYGIGGHYEPHYDFRMEGDADRFAEMGIGNRIATWIYYLSDVEAGGSTVFPLAGVQVKPIKGSAAFWWNLRKSGAGDMYTQHAACPVLTGSKWVANKWLHEVGNEFRRKCTLNRND